MLKGLGTDIVSVKRIQRVIERRGTAFLTRIFTEKERAYCEQFKKHATHRYAGRFAAKEAVSKALGVGIGKALSWKDIEILPSPTGAPTIQLSKEAATRFSDPDLHVSISHEKNYAVAFVISS